VPKATNVRLVDATGQSERFGYRAPMKFGGRVVTEAVLLHVTVEVEACDGRHGKGFGSMPMGNTWAWPSKVLANDETLQAMIQFGYRLVDEAKGCHEGGHPLEITHRLTQSYQPIADQVVTDLGLEEAMPRLAQLVAASPLEAAIHDAYGKTLGQNAYNLLSREYVNTDLASYLGAEFAGEYLDQYTLRSPKPSMPLYHLVGALDPLTEADVAARIDDGLPETLPEWIAADGLTHMKIKLSGDDLAWDVERVASVDRVATEAQRRRGCSTWFYSADFNERCESVQYVLDFLVIVHERAPKALERLQYIEQPTIRELRSCPENRVHEAAKLKPIVIDESLVDLNSLLLARDLGYSGVALKACKGHSEALCMGAAAQKYQMFLCVQDLTCPGSSFLHSASLASRIPTVAALEGNARQYVPAANQGWAERFPTMFQIRDGTVGTAVLDGPGLGF
jgi:L-alanine-DL-glutamate epimerase-like enolase superfamily enzyme